MSQADRRDVLPTQGSGSPLPTDLERSGSQGPRIKDLSDLFVTCFRTPLESANKSVRSRFGVNTAENVGAPNPVPGST
jgi:hypothetical protein